MWATRMALEAQLHKENCFITLTYNDEHLPKVDGWACPTLVKKDLQNFIKRLRRRFDLDAEKWNSYLCRKRVKPPKIKYYGCGEYGEDKGRPHYHVCIFGWDDPDKKLYKLSKSGKKIFNSKILEDVWTDPKTKKLKGWVTTQDLTFKSAAYVARYTMKKQKGKNKETAYEAYTDLRTGEIKSIVPEFALMSRRPAIAKEWIEKYHHEVYSGDQVYVNGLLLKPPKYFDKMYEDLYPDKMARIKGKRNQEAKRNWLESTLQRLIPKEKCKKEQIKSLQRSIEND
jgi:hypothetical protein